MPIHDQSYRRYQGRREGQHGLWSVIALTGIRSIFRKRAFLGLLLFAWIPFVIRAVQLYLAVNYPSFAQFLSATRETFHEFLDQQGFFVFVITIWVGAGLIARDRRANALQIYLSKPLTRAEYIAGKFGILAVFLLLVTWVPAMLLLVLQMLFAGSFAFVRANLSLFPAITVYSFVQVLAVSFMMLALSSLSNNSRFVAVLYAGVYMFTQAVFAVMTAATGHSTFSWISFDASIKQVGCVIFRQSPQYETPWGISLLVVLAFVSVSIWILERRVRGVEVVT